MINEDPIYELIEDYLQGTLSEQDEARVKARMSQDPLFEKEVEESAYLNHVIEGAGIDILREKMTYDIQKIDHNNTLKRNILKAVGIISLIAGLIFSVFSLYQKEKVHPSSVNDSDTKEKVKKELPDIDSNSDTLVSEQNISLSDVNKAKGEKVILKASTGKETVDAVLQENERIIEGKVGTDTNSVEAVAETISDVGRGEEKSDSIFVKQPIEKSESAIENCVLTFNAEILASCTNKNTGAINISMDGKGQAPYKYSLNHSENNTGSFSGLASQTYSVNIVDSKGCKGEKVVFVPEEPCYEEPRAYSFAPDFGEQWKILPQEGKDGIFTIINKSGQVIKKGVLDNEANNKWDGTDSKGAIVSQGMYICLFNYSDGSVEKVEVTVIR